MHLIGHRKTRTEQLLEQGQHLVEDLAQRAEDLATRAAPHVDAAKALAQETAQQKVLPAAATAAAMAKAKADQHLPHRQQQKTHKVRNTFVVLGLAGVGAAAWRLLTNKHEQLPYVPPSPDRAPASAMQVPPQPRHAGATQPAPTDAGGASPTEALSDASEGPHLATTPDSPRDAEFLDREP